MKFQFGIRTKCRQLFRNLTSSPNKNALFIFGFQKSGTSAIAGLLAEKTNKSVTIDTKYLWEPYQSQILDGRLNLSRQVRKFSYDFSKEIIKEPSATFFIPEIAKVFELKRYVFIVRNPYDNIRSILNRLSLPGHLEDITYENIIPSWQYIFSERRGKDYISVLADRWVLANDQQSIIESERCILVRYEDFNIDKEDYITNLAKRLNMESVKSISRVVDKQYQPKGNPEVDLKEFFGSENLQKIKNICGELMHDFGYNKHPVF